MVFMTSSQSGAIGRFKNIAKHRIGNPGSQSTRPPTGAACDIDSSWNAFCIALRGAGHGAAMGYGQELDHPLRAGAIIDLYRGPVSHVQRFFLTTIWALQVPLAAANKINAANLVIDVFMSKAHDAPVHQIRPSQIEKSVRSLTESGLTWNASSGARRKAL
jgi:hypothetical protein